MVYMYTQCSTCMNEGMFSLGVVYPPPPHTHTWYSSGYLESELYTVHGGLAYKEGGVRAARNHSSEQVTLHAHLT